MERGRVFWISAHIYLLIAIVEKSSAMPRSDYIYSEEWAGYYKLHTTKRAWDKAMPTCQEEGATLAMPHTLKGTYIIRSIVNDNKLDMSGIFIGAKGSDKGFKTLDGISLCRIPHTWDTGEPENTTNFCLAMRNTGKFGYEMCTEIMPFVCYAMEGKSEECSNQCKNKEYTFKQQTGSCYKFHNEAKTWTDAFDTCVQEGGHLAIINSEIEDKILQEIFTKMPCNFITGALQTHQVHIGFHKLFKVDDWINVDGTYLEDSGFANWADMKPDKVLNSENCGSMFRDGLLNDVPCANKYGFICEMETGPQAEL